MTLINEKVVVGMSDKPKWILWRGKTHKIEKIGLHYTLKEGDILHHIFSVTSATLYMKLSLNTKYLTWNLVETFPA